VVEDAEAVADGDGCAVTVDVGEAVALGEPDCEPVTEPDGEADVVVEDEVVGDPVVVGEAVAVAVGEEEDEAVATADAEGEAVGEPVGDPEDEKDTVALGDPLADCESVCVRAAPGHEVVGLRKGYCQGGTRA
jgi:hypothetical protein